VIAISEAVLRYLVDSREIRKNQPTSVIHYGYRRRTKRLINHEYGVISKLNTIRIGTIARLVPQKNIRLLVNLGNQLKERGIDFSIRIVGEGPDEPLLKDEIIQHGLQDKIIFLGKLSDVMEFLRDLDVFVLTSNYEGFGLALLEAMDAELPIIAPRNSAIPEVLGESHPGLFESGSSEALTRTLLNLMTNWDCRIEFLRKQSKQLDYFTTERYFRKHHDLYNRASL
jgi:glycosyltransferase involved in cell wall biosynthesis